MPLDLRIPEVELQRMKARSKNLKHLACQLLKMFSELFDSYEKHQYNWFGGGSKGKKMLDAERRYIAQNYVEFYHPEVKKNHHLKGTVLWDILTSFCLKRKPTPKDDFKVAARRQWRFPCPAVVIFLTCCYCVIHVLT